MSRRYVELAIEGTLEVAINATIVVEADDDDMAAELAEDAWRDRQFSRFRIENIDYEPATTVDVNFIEEVGIWPAPKDA